MSYEIRLKEKAESDLNGLPVWLQGLTESHLDRLADHPLDLSRKVVTPPHPPGGMVSEIAFGPVDGKMHHITTFFLYGQDEESIIVTRIVDYPY